MKLIDTFPAFLDFWHQYKNLPVEEQIDGWAEEYLSRWQELLHKQIEEYKQDGYDWRDIARERIFPNLNDRISAMDTAHQNLSMVCRPVINDVKDKLGLEIDLIAVIYVGIGLGAGWATSYAGSPAILLGLENIAEEGWLTPEILAGLIAHEAGHLAHFQWRELAGLVDGSGPWWQLYTEGFAQWCENLIQPDSWHMADRRQEGWLHWCQENKKWLAGEFLRRVHSGENVVEFFGSWYNLKGFKQSGYFLGFELIQALCQNTPYRELALLRDFESPLKLLLQYWAES